MGLNPVTFRGEPEKNGGKRLALTLGRLMISPDAGKTWQYPLTAVLYEEPEGEVLDVEQHVKGQVVLDANHVIGGLKLLFPNGELNQQEPPELPVVKELLRGLLQWDHTSGSVDGEYWRGRIETVLKCLG